MNTIEQMIEAAKLAATTEEQKRSAKLASLVYNAMRLQQLQKHIVTLQEVLLLGCAATTSQEESLQETIKEDLAEITRIQQSMNVECTEQYLDILKKYLIW